MEIRLIGRPQILDGTGVERPVRGYQSWALLARILMTERPLSRRDLSAELFSSAADPLGALRWCLAGLRRALGSGQVLLGDPVVSALNDDVIIDVSELEAGRFNLDRAEALLAGIDPRCSPELETWLLVQRHRVAGQIDAMLRSEVIDRLSVGNAAGALELATVSVQRDVYDEGVHVLLVKSLVGVGAHEAAEAHVLSTTDLFRAELGHDPTPALLDAARPRLADPPPGVPPRAIVASLLESGRAALAAGAPDAGVELLRRAAQDSQQTNDRHLAATCLYELGSALVHAVRSHDEEGAVLLRQSAMLASELGDHRVGAEAFRELAYIDALAGRRPTAVEHLQQASTLAGDDPHLLAGVRSVRAFNLADWGHFEEATEEYTAAVDLARQTGSTRREAWTLGLGAWAQIAAGDLPEARAWTEECLALTDRTRWFAFRPWPIAVLAEAELADGGITASTGASLDEAFALSCHMADPCWEGATARMISLRHAANGDLDEARAWIDQALHRSQRSTDTYASMLAAILASAGQLSAEAGDGVHTEQYARSLVALAARAHLDHYLPQGVAILDSLHRNERSYEG